MTKSKDITNETDIDYIAEGAGAEFKCKSVEQRLLHGLEMLIRAPAVVKNMCWLPDYL